MFCWPWSFSSSITSAGSGSDLCSFHLHARLPGGFARSTLFMGSGAPLMSGIVRTLETAEKLRQAEARNLLSENAASVGRLAAALSHELNSPIGALVSGVDTLLLLAARQAHSSPPEQQRLIVLQNELRKSIQQSTDRLREIVAECSGSQTSIRPKFRRRTSTI